MSVAQQRTLATTLQQMLPAADEASDTDQEIDQREHRRRELPPEAVSILKSWLLSPDHFEHPYPSAQDQQQLLAATGIGKKQLKNWFTNARRRIWKPLMKKRQEQAQNLHFHAFSNLATSFDITSGIPFPRNPVIHWSTTASAPAQCARVVQTNTQEPLSKKLSTSPSTTRAVERVDSYAILESLLEDGENASETSSESNEAGRTGAAEASTLPCLSACLTRKRESEYDAVTTNHKKHRQHDEEDQDDFSKYAPDIDGNPKTAACRPATYQQPNGEELPFVVPVSPSYQCLFCTGTRVDTQLLPCQHFFHGTCLRTWLLEADGVPQCPVCCSSIASCVLAIPCAAMSVHVAIPEGQSYRDAHSATVLNAQPAQADQFHKDVKIKTCCASILRQFAEPLDEFDNLFLQFFAYMFPCPCTTPRLGV